MDIKNMQKKAFEACKLEFIDLRGEDIITASTDNGFTTQEDSDYFTNNQQGLDVFDN